MPLPLAGGSTHTAACLAEQVEATLDEELFLNALEEKAKAGVHDREYRGRLCKHGWRA